MLGKIKNKIITWLELDKAVEKIVDSLNDLNHNGSKLEDRVIKLERELKTVGRLLAECDKKANLSEGVHKRLRKVEDLERNHSTAISLILSKINL